MSPMSPMSPRNKQQWCSRTKKNALRAAIWKNLRVKNNNNYVLEPWGHWGHWGHSYYLRKFRHKPSSALIYHRQEERKIIDISLFEFFTVATRVLDSLPYYLFNEQNRIAQCFEYFFFLWIIVSLWCYF